MINYRLANIGDNQQLLELTRSAGMSGKMALRIDRQPDFFKLNTLRGKTNVYVATENELIVGSISVTHQNVYIEKNEYPLFYISDFKVATTHRHLGIGLQLTNEVVKYLETQNADFAFLNVSKGNRRPFVFFSERSHYPDFENIGLFKVFQFLGSSKEPSSSNKFNIEPSKLTSEVLDFLNKYYSQYQLASVIEKERNEATQFYVVRQEHHLKAVLGIIDTMPMKQNVALSLPWYFSLFINCINGMSNLLRVSKLPKVNDPIKMLNIKYLATEVNDKKLVALLLNYAQKRAFDKSYSFVSIGLHEKDPLIKTLPKSLKFTFYSVGMLVSMKDSKELMYKIKKGIPFKDYSIV